MTKVSYVGTLTLVLVMPFELWRPLLKVPGQSLSSDEAALAVVFAASATAIAWSRVTPRWRTPLTAPFLALIGAMALATLSAPADRVNALHMTARLAVAFVVFLLAAISIDSPARVRGVLYIAATAGAMVGALAILEYLRVGSVSRWLEVFRPSTAVVGSQLRAAGPLQYPTIASMYLEILFALSLGVLPWVIEHRGRSAAVLLIIAIVVMAEAVTLTFTRAGLITIATSVAIVGAVRLWQRGFDAGFKAVAAVAVAIAVLFSTSRSLEATRLRLTSETQDAWYRAIYDAPAQIAIDTGSMATIPVSLTNVGRLTWDPDADEPFRLSYHWLVPDADLVVSYEGRRTPLPSPVRPGQTVVVPARVEAPREPGRYRLVWDVVQEGRLWFSTEPGAELTYSHATVVGPAPGTLNRSTLTQLPRPAVRPGRLVLWRAAARMFASHPVLGVGPDNFRLSYGQYANLRRADPRTHSNNMYLEVLVGGGIVAAIAFVWLLWRATSAFAATLSSATAGIAAAGVAIALHGFVDSFLSFTPTYVLIALTLGLAVSCAQLPLDTNANRI